MPLPRVRLSDLRIHPETSFKSGDTVFYQFNSVERLARVDKHGDDLFVHFTHELNPKTGFYEPHTAQQGIIPGLLVRRGHVMRVTKK